MSKRIFRFELQLGSYWQNIKLPQIPHIYRNHNFSIICNFLDLLLHPGGGHWPRKGVWGCAAVMTPFFRATRRSLAYQFTIIAPLLCPPFSNFRKIFNFQPCFGQNFSSQDANFPNFRSLDPSFFKENPLPRPYFWKPVWHTPTKKKVECPPPPGCVISIGLNFMAGTCQEYSFSFLPVVSR